MRCFGKNKIGRISLDARMNTERIRNEQKIGVCVSGLRHATLEEVPPIMEAICRIGGNGALFDNADEFVDRIAEIIRRTVPEVGGFFKLRHQLRADSKRRILEIVRNSSCLLYTSPSPRDRTRSRMPSSA